MRKLEAVFAVLIATMALSFAWMFGEAKPSGIELLIGIGFYYSICDFSCQLYIYIYIYVAIGDSGQKGCASLHLFI